MASKKYDDLFRILILFYSILTFTLTDIWQVFNSKKNKQEKFLVYKTFINNILFTLIDLIFFFNIKPIYRFLGFKH